MAVITLHREHHDVVLVTCPSCGHADLSERPRRDRLAASMGHPHRCSYSVGDEISPLRNEMCACADPVHARGAC